MAISKVSELVELTTAAADDLLLITDSDISQSKKIQKSNITQENFTTTLKNKLDGVEAGATADQTAQEIATAIDADVTAENTLKSALGLGTAAYTASTDYATAAQGSNADTAYGWGDHASAGYLTSYTVTEGDVTAHEAALSITEGQISNLGSDIVLDSDIGVTVQAYDADTAKYDDTTANFTGTLQNGGSNVIVDTDIGSTVQAYDADTAKYYTFSTTIGGSGGSSDWTGSDPYTAAMTVSGILSTDVPVADINLSSVTFADVEAVQADWALVYRVAATADNQLTFYATAEPVEDLTVQIQVVR